MAILATGNTFADGDQVTSTTLNNIANAATFAADAVDDSTTELSSGKIIIKDGGVTPAKLSTNHPNWDSTGLGVGTSSPTSKLDIESSSSSADGIDINNTSTGDPVLEFQLAGTSKFVMGVDNSDSDKFKIGTTAVETSTCLTIDSTGPKLTIGSGAAADTAIIFDGNAQDFYIALDDSADDLLIGLGSTIGTTPAISIDENLKSTFGGDVVIGGTTPTLTIGDAGAEDTAIVFDGNAQDFYIGLDDSADDLVIGLGSTVGTTPSISVDENQLATFGAGITSTAAANTLGATSFNDADISNVGSIALDTITNDGTDVTIDSSGDIILDADGADIRLKDAGQEFGAFTNSSSSLVIGNYISDKDIIFKGNDGGSTITALTLDMSGAGAATFNDKIVATELDISGNIDVDGTSHLDIVDIDGAVDMATTALVTGVLTTTATQVATGGITSGSNILSDTDSTDSLGSTGVRWLKGWFDTLTAGTLTIGSGSVTDSSGAISFGNENLTTTGIVTAAGTSVFTNLDVSGDVDVDGTLETDAFSINGTTVSSTAAELNILDGVTSTTAELNILDGVTSTAAELNILDGVTSTAAELNLLDGSSANSVVNSKAVIYGSSGEVAGTLSTAAQGNVTSLGTLTALTVDNLGVNGNTITANSGALNLTPASGSAIVLDGTINVDAGVVTGATSITSTAFAGALTGDVTGNVSGTAATVTTAAQSSITSLGTLTTIDVNGTSNLDAVDIDGNVQIDGTVTVGVNDTGKDVKFFGAADGAYMLWDESVDDLKLVGGAGFSVSGGLLDCSNDSGAARVRQQVASDRGYLYLYSENNYAIGRWYGDANGSIISLYETEAQQSRVKMGVDESDDGFIFVYSNGNVKTIDISGDGTIAKSSSTFNIPHPLESKRDTHRLVHSVIEGPQADLIYRGKVDLVDGSAEIDIDSVSGMTDGTFVVLCRDVQSFTTNESGWTAVRSSVSGNTLTIEAQDNTCTDSISWMVVGERQDDHMMNTDWTDENGKAIVEPLNPEPEPEEEEIEPEEEEEEEDE
jgi:hypothetical protein